MGRKQRCRKRGHWAGRPQPSPLLLSHSHRHCGRGLRVAVRVKRLAFLGDFCKPVSRDTATSGWECCSCRLALRIIGLSQLAGGVLSKGREGWRTEITDIPTDPEVQGWRSPGSQAVEASGPRSGTEPEHLPPQTPHEGLWVRAKGQEAECEH